MSDSIDSTRCAAVMTGIGRGAVATVRAVGDCSEFARAELFRPVSGRPLHEHAIDRVVFGDWGQDGKCEQIVACRVSERMTELHCHGGVAAVQTLLQSLSAIGWRIVSAFELMVQTDGFWEAEAALVQSHATTVKTATWILKTVSVLHRAVSSLREGCATGSPNWPDLERRLTNILRWADFGEHLTTPWRIGIVGPVNVGKSSLLNTLLGYERAIVFNEPGTTRDVVTAQLALDGWPVELADTAGIRRAADTNESAGIRYGQEWLSTCDIQVLVVDRSQSESPQEQELADRWPTAIRVANKVDLADARDGQLSEWIQVSARTRTGIEELVDVLVRTLVPELPAAGSPIPYSGRQRERLASALQAVKSGESKEAYGALDACLHGEGGELA